MTNAAAILRVDACWDDEAGVWSAFSVDVAGLAIEAATKVDLIQRLKTVIPELMELNHTSAEKISPAGIPKAFGVS